MAGGSEPVETMALDLFKSVHEVNVLGPLRMMQSFLPEIRRSKGRIINISRSVGLGLLVWATGDT